MSSEEYTEQEKRELEQLARDHLWMHARSWEDMSKPDGVRIMIEADGTQVTDINGNTYFDLMAGLWLVNVGHGRKEIADAVSEQMQQLSYADTWTNATLPAINLAAKIADLAPGSLNRVFFVNGGSDAVDCCIRMAKQYQYLAGFKKRYKVVARRSSYHGSFTGGQSATGGGFFARKYFEPMQPGVRHVPHPYCYRCQYELTYPDCNLLCAKAIEQELLFEDPETVAAVIGETIGGATGVIPPPEGYWPMVRSICDKYGVLLIMDEVICGFGRTGKWFGFENYDVIPDITSIAKGLSSGYMPIAAALARDEVFEQFKGGYPEAFQHGTTWGAHPVSCAAALANVNIIEREDLPGQAAENGKYMLDSLNELLSHPTVGDVRGIGMLAGVEMVEDKSTKKSFDAASPYPVKLGERLLAQGLLTRVRGIICISPPLITTKKDIDEIVGKIDNAIGDTEKELGMSG